jgi:hypothetical protein
MKMHVFIVAGMILAGCTHPGNQTVLPVSASIVNPMDAMLKRDQDLRERFVGVAKGMTELEVKHIMGIPPHDIIRKTTWVYKLSPASDSITERHWKLLVRFSDGKVQDFQDTYDCYYVEIRE